jgi:large subunit ribosomal protein L21
LYAVIRVGGKQERVAPGDVIEVEFMKVDPGSAVEFEPILVVDDDGKAHHGKGLSKAKVTAKLLGDKKADKIRVFKYRPKSGYRRNMGHRQVKTVLEVEEVALSPQVKAAAPAAEKPAPEPAKAAATKSPGKKPATKTATRKPTSRKAPARKTPAKKTTSRKKAT